MINFVIRIFAYHRDKAGHVVKWPFDSMATLNVIVSPNKILKCDGTKWASKFFVRWLYAGFSSRAESRLLLDFTIGQ